MKIKILSAVTILLLLGSSAGVAATFSYESDGGFVEASPIGTNTAFSSNLDYIAPQGTLGGDNVWRGIDWGISASNAGKSGLRTVPKTGTVVSYPSGTVPVQEPFGDLEHINQPITTAGGSLIYTNIRWHLKVTDVATSQVFEHTWDFDLFNWETSNGANPCPNLLTPPIYSFPNGVTVNGQDSHTFTYNATSGSQCDDAHDFAVTTTQDFTWTIGNTVYRVNGSGFYDENGVLKRTFWAPEDGTSTGSVKFFIEEVGPNTVTVGNRVWVDLNHNGVQDDAPHAVAVIPVELWGFRNGTRDNTLDQFSTTDSNGFYQFRNVDTGNDSTDTLTYKIKFSFPPVVADKFEFSPKDRGADDALDSDVDATGLTDAFSLNADRDDIDAGIMLGAIGNYVWVDTDKNGIQGSGEIGLEDVKVELYKDGSTTSPYETLTTGVNGEYLFEPLGQGTYHLKFYLPSGYEFSPQNATSDDTKDSDADITTGETIDISMVFDADIPSAHLEDWDAGMSIIPLNNPSIHIEKTTNGLSSSTGPGEDIYVGSAIRWNYIIINDGNESLSSIILTDDPIGTITCPQDTLAIGERMTCTTTGTAILGAYENNGTVQGTAIGTQIQPDVDVNASDLSHYNGIPIPVTVPSLLIEKSTNGRDSDIVGEDITVGTLIKWEYVITNNGDVALDSLTLTDDKLGGITCPKTTLAVAEQMTCVTGGTAVLGAYTNTGTVEGRSTFGTSINKKVSASDTSSYTGISSDTGAGGEENCPCNDVKSDSSSTFGTVSAALMMLMTLMAGLFFVRRESQLSRNER